MAQENMDWGIREAKHNLLLPVPTLVLRDPFKDERQDLLIRIDGEVHMNVMEHCKGTDLAFDGPEAKALLSLGRFIVHDCLKVLDDGYYLIPAPPDDQYTHLAGDLAENYMEGFININT